MTTSSTISAFASAFPDETHLPSSPSYASLAANHWASNVIQSPACIFTPTTPSTLSLALRHITAHSIPFSIRSGGHSTNRSWSTISTGILISTSALTTISWLDPSTLRIGAGVHFPAVYAFLHASNRTIAGGNQALPGVAGFYLGGGVGPYWNRVGYAANTLVAVEVVLADGEVVVASEDERGDLFWALKGGLGNFGIVTAVVVRAFETGNVFAGVDVVAREGYGDAFEAMGRFCEEFGGSEVAAASLIGAGKGNVMVGMFYDGPHDDEGALPREFAAFRDLPKVKSTFQKTNWVGIAKSSQMTMPSGLRRYWSMLTIHHDMALLSRLFDYYHDSAAKKLVGVEAGPFMILALPQSKASMRHNHNGPWSYDGPDQDLISILLLPTWKHAADDEKVRQWTEEVTTELNDIARKAEKLHRFLYINDVNEKQDALGSLDEKVITRLREVSRKYDPNGVFQSLRKGGPKLW